MKRRPKWSHITIALGVIAALAIASPVFGVSASIKKAIKKEVAKQVRNTTGPAGTNGTIGANGTNGATNVVVREASSSTLVPMGGGNGASSTANCVGSERAIGGGATWDEIVVAGMAIGASTPQPSGTGSVPTGWLVTATNSTGIDHHVRAKVVCASP